MPSSEKKYTKYDEDNMRLAIRAVQFGGWSKSKAAKTYSVPRTTLNDKLSGKNSLGMKVGRDTYLKTIEETAIVSWNSRVEIRGLKIAS